jgi:hypothetical protein
MPFAGAFRKAMGFPVVGDVIGGFTVLRVEVGHEGIGSGRYEYPVEMVLQGKGGQQGVKRALKGFLDTRRTLFSGYGNPYQCRFGRMEVESQGQGRYRLTGKGIGVRIYLRSELMRFLSYLAGSGRMRDGSLDSSADQLVTDYMAEYQVQARRKPRRPVPP